MKNFLEMKGAAMSELPEGYEKCIVCGMTDEKECMWATGYGGYLCNDCYWEDLEDECTDE